jgi:hypothetical protein
MRSRKQTSREARRERLALASILGVLAGGWSAPIRAASYVEVNGCRPPAEEGEFLQSCVKVASGRGEGTVLGPGLVAPGGSTAAILHHKKYGHPTDRVTVRLYGARGKLESSFPMGSGGEEFLMAWAPASSRFLAWVEVDGRGGVVKVIDCRKRRIIFSALSPLEEWPLFAPRSARLLIPRGGKGQEPMALRVQSAEVVDLLTRERRVILRADSGEELVDLRWISTSTLGATLRRIGAGKGKNVQAAFERHPL